MEPEQINPTPVEIQPKTDHKIFYILILIFLAIIGSFSYLFYLQYNYNPMCVSDCSSIVVPDFDETSDWKTYRNEEYGFEFKYPSNWVKLDNYQTDPDLITIVSSNESADNVSKCYEGCGPDLWFYHYKNIDLEKYINDPGNLLFNPKKIKIDGQTAYEVDEAGFSSYYAVLVQKGNDVYKILGYNNQLSLSSNTIESQILSTFKFIDKTDTSTWKTYRNEVYGYEFKYPNGSYVESNNGNIRIQNYNGYRQGLASGEFWLDFNEKPGKGSCKSEATSLNKKQDDLGIYYIGPLPFTEMNESGGERFVLCADKSGNSIFIQAFENNINGPLVNQILSTFKFTK